MLVRHRYRYAGTWTARQPPPGHAPLVVNPTHWATPALRGVWVLGRGVPVNLVTGEVAVAISSPAARIGPPGPAYYTGLTSRNGWLVRSGTLVANTSAWTVAAIARVDSSATAGDLPIYGERSTAATNDILKLELNTAGSSGRYGLVYRDDGGTLSWTPTSGADWRDDKVHIVAGSMRTISGSLRLDSFIDGAQEKSLVRGAGTAQTNAGLISTIACDPYSLGAGYPGDISLVVVSGDGWSDAQHAAFAADPWSIVMPAG